MRFLKSLCRHTSVLASKSKDKHDLMALEWIVLTFHTYRANSNGSLLPCTIINPNGAQMVAPINSSLDPLVPSVGTTRVVFFRRGMRPEHSTLALFVILGEWNLF